MFTPVSSAARILTYLAGDLPSRFSACVPRLSSHLMVAYPAAGWALMVKRSQSFMQGGYGSCITVFLFRFSRDPVCSFVRAILLHGHGCMTPRLPTPVVSYLPLRAPTNYKRRPSHIDVSIVSNSIQFLILSKSLGFSVHRSSLIFLRRIRSQGVCQA